MEILIGLVTMLSVINFIMVIGTAKAGQQDHQRIMIIEALIGQIRLTDARMQEIIKQMSN